MTFSRPGAIDLSALSRPQQPAAGPGAGGSSAPGGASWVTDVTEADFQAVALEASARHLVVLNLWSPRAQNAQGFNDLLARVTNEQQGQVLLANVDVDANPGIAQAMQIQGVPFVAAVVGGQLVPLFQSTAEESDVRQVFAQLLALGAQQGITGRAEPVGAAAPAEVDDEPADDPRFAAADAAFGAGDVAGAVAEYEKLLAQAPADAEVAERLAGVKLFGRTQGADLQTARSAAAGAPDDVDAQLLVADLDVSGGHVDDAFDRLIDLVRRTAGDDRDRVRERLLELFTVVGTSDDRVALARRALASALF